MLVKLGFKATFTTMIYLKRCRTLKRLLAKTSFSKCSRLSFLKYSNVFTVSYYHVTYAFQSRLNVKELLALNKRDI